MLQNATLLRKSAPWPPNISDEHVSCTALATRHASLQILFKCPTPAMVFWKCYNPLAVCSLLTRCTIPCACHAKRHLNVQKCSVPVSFEHLWLRNVLRAATACTFSTSQPPKVVWDRQFFKLLTSMCFAPKRRALFHHLNFQRWSETVSFFFALLTSKCASKRLTVTVANGCGRLRTVAATNATSSEHTLNPQTPRVKRGPLLRIREYNFWIFLQPNGFFSDRTWLPQFMLPNVYVFLPFDGGSMCASLNPFKCIWHESARTASLVTQRSALMLDKNYWRNNMQNLCWSESLFFELFDMYGFVWA